MVCGDVTLYKEGINEECGCIDLTEHCYPQIKEYGNNLSKMKGPGGQKDTAWNA